MSTDQATWTNSRIMYNLKKATENYLRRPLENYGRHPRRPAGVLIRQSSKSRVSAANLSSEDPKKCSVIFIAFSTLLFFSAGVSGQFSLRTCNFWIMAIPRLGPSGISPFATSNQSMNSTMHPTSSNYHPYTWTRW